MFVYSITGDQVAALLQHGADASDYDSAGRSLLHRCMSLRLNGRNQLAALEDLLRHGGKQVKINEPDPYGTMPLVFPILRGNLPLLRLLLAVRAVHCCQLLSAVVCCFVLLTVHA